MSDDSLEINRDAHAITYEDQIPIRGCTLTLKNIRDAYRELQKINFSEGEKIIAKISKRDGEGDQEFEERKRFLLDDAFRITVTIYGSRDQSAYGQTEAIFDEQEMPGPIKRILFTNVTAYMRHSGEEEPVNRFAVNIDFSKPSAIDPNIVVSAETPNPSSVGLRARDVTLYRAVQHVVNNTLSSKRHWYSFIHGKMVYDIGVWIVALPLGLLFATYYMDQLLPVGSRYDSFRWGFFLYVVGISLVAYRMLNGYIKWVFPVNILKENKYSANWHRSMLAGIAGLLAYKVWDIFATLVTGF